MNKQIKFIFLTLVGLFLLLYFYPILLGKVLIGDDFGHATDWFLDFRRFFGQSWYDDFWLGHGNASYYPNLSIRRLVILFFPDAYGISSNTVYLVATLLMLIAGYQLFRGFKFETIPSLVGSIILTFSPIYYSYIRTGHLGKIYTVIFFTFTFIFINSIWYKKNKTPYLLLGAISLLLGLNEEAYQTYVYFFAVLFFYILFIFYYHYYKEQTLKSYLQKNRKSILSFILIPLVFFILGFNDINNVYQKLTQKTISSKITTDKINLKAATKSPAKNNYKKSQDLRQWNWATQWSFPVEESTEFFVPGIYGFLSNDAEAPYWGGVGRELSWNIKNQQGVFNYSLTTSYLGIFLWIFLIYALFFVDKKIKWFWLIGIIVTLLLSYGRYAPFYEIIYNNFPYVDKVRNPNKFLLIFYWLVAVLAVFGLNDFYQKVKKRYLNKKKNSFPRENNFFKRFIIISNSLLILALILCFLNESNIKAHLEELFAKNQFIARMAYNNIIFYIFKALIFHNLALGLLFYIIAKNIKLKTTKTLSIIALFFLLLDQYLVNRHFLNFQNLPASPNNQLVKFFKTAEKEGPYRIKLGGKVNQYIDYFKWRLSRENKIPIMEYRDLRDGRFPQRDYNYLTKVTNPDLRILKLANVRYLMNGEAIRDPNLLLAHNLKFNNTKEEVFIYEVKDYLPKLYLADQLILTPEKKILETLNSPQFNIKNTVVAIDNLEKNPTWLSDYYKKYNYPSSPSSQEELVLLPGYDRSEYHLKLNINKPKILVLLNNNRDSFAGGKYGYRNTRNSYWDAYHKGKPINKVDVNYYFNGFIVEPSMKEVTVKYGHAKAVLPTSHLLYYLLILGIFLYFQLSKNKKKPTKFKN